MFVEQIKCSSDGGGSFSTLHRCRGQNYTGQGITGAQDAQHIAQRCRLERSYDADYGGLGRQRALALLVEEAFSGQARFELLEAQKEGSFSDGLNAVDVELEFAIALVK